MRRCGDYNMEELPEIIRRVEIYFDKDRKPVKKLSDASFKYVTLYDEEGELTEQYRVEIINGVDMEYEEEGNITPKNKENQV